MESVTDLVPQVKAGRTRATPSAVVRHQMSLSQALIPAVHGEYYSYPALFTKRRPLYALMKCKSNKTRELGEIAALGSEINALFDFDGENPKILSIKAAIALNLLGNVGTKHTFTNIWFSATTLTPEQFIELRDGKEAEDLVKVCTESLIKRRISADLREELVVVFMTDTGKYGMFLVEEITDFSIQIEACHIQL
jgi:hypothetical protein